MKKLKQSLLQLNEYWIESASLKTDPEASNVANGSIPLSYDVAYCEPTESDGTCLFVRLRVKTQRTAKKIHPYEIDLTLVGRFSVSAKANDDSLAHHLIQYNAPAILYGIARGVVASLTSFGHAGRFDLPSANFVRD